MHTHKQHDLRRGGDRRGASLWQEPPMNNVCVCIYIYIYIYIHTHIYTHMSVLVDSKYPVGIVKSTKASLILCRGDAVRGD